MFWSLKCYYKCQCVSKHRGACWPSQPLHRNWFLQVVFKTQNYIEQITTTGLVLGTNWNTTLDLVFNYKLKYNNWFSLVYKLNYNNWFSLVYKLNYNNWFSLVYKMNYNWFSLVYKLNYNNWFSLDVQTTTRKMCLLGLCCLSKKCLV